MLERRTEERSTQLSQPGSLPEEAYCSFIEISGKKSLRAEILRISNNRFEIQEVIGRGGMADVWRTLDTVEERIVALKTPHRFDAERTSETVSDDNYHRRVRAFQQEALLAKALDHPNIVQATHIVLSLNNEICYYVTPYFEHGSLRQQLDQGVFFCADHSRLSVERVMRWGVCLLDALCYLQEIGITHRDIKPANLFISDDDVMMLNDFGLAEYTGPSNAGLLRRIPSRLRKVQPSKFARAGTPSYMSPEQFELPVHLLDQRSDIYSIGVLMYELLLGEHPFPETRTVWAHPKRVPTPLSVLREEIGEDLSIFVQSCLALQREERPQTPISAKELLERALYSC